VVNSYIAGEGMVDGQGRRVNSMEVVWTDLDNIGLHYRNNMFI